MQKLDEFEQRCMKIAVENFRDNPELDGVVLLTNECADHESNAVWGIRFDGDQEKHIALTMATGSLRFRETERYAIMSLAWSGNAENGARPSEDPDRKEVLLLVVADKNGNKRANLWTVVRNSDDMITEFTDKMSMNTTGVMASLLERFDDMPLPVQAMADFTLGKCMLSGNQLVGTISDPDDAPEVKTKPSYH